MIRSPLWREWESGDSAPLRLLRLSVLFCGLIFLLLTGVLGLPWPQQAMVALLTVVIAVWLDRTSSSYLVTLTLMLLSVYSTFRYGFWRTKTTVGYFRDPATSWSGIDAFFMGVLLLSECYAFVVLFLGYLQMAWPLRRTPVPLPDDTADWPAVDVLIPTLNEPLEVVRFTALAALNMDWPAEKLNVYILDDGRRDAFREFAEEAGVGYMTRADNLHAKAGNLNAALDRVESPFVVVFDSDHVPTRSFLQVTMGWFLRDARLGILQTPHHFYSPDPFDRNLGQFRSIPNEDELFYGVVQDGNDFWNATYFCGSCAVLRRSALDEVGGMAVETVTEDAHTSMRMQRRGWNSAYINIPQAAGLATERLSGHVRQRIRWARGMVQILRLENPLFAPGLKPAQRLCYFNAMSHFLYALPRLIFLTAPLMYLIFGYINIAGSWLAVLAYAAPHLVLSSVTRSRMQGAHRHSFWTEIYETVLSPYLLFPTLLALVSPKLGKFNVTAKGSVVDEEFFDQRMARPTLVLLSCNWFGLCCALPRLMRFPAWDVPAWASFVNWPATLYDPVHAGTIWINASWTVFNMVLLGVALAVAWESQQRRKTVRVEMQVPSEVVLADGSIVRGITADISSGGVRTTMEYDIPAEPGDAVSFVFPVLDGTAVLPATVVGMDGRMLRARFDRLNLEELEALTLILYSRADRWLGWGESREPDKPVRSLMRILRLALRGLGHTVFGARPVEVHATRGGFASALPLLALALCAGFGERTAGGGQTARPAVDPLVALAGTVHSAAAGKDQAGEFHAALALRDLGERDPIVLHGTESSRTLHFSIPQNELVKSGTFRLRYQFTPGDSSSGSRLTIGLNGTVFVSLPASEEPVESLVPLPPELLTRSNDLTFAFSANSGLRCEAAATGTGRIDPESSIELNGTTIPLQDELSLLPMPFYQEGVSAEPRIPIVFLGQPSAKAREAAAIVASWFGALANSHPVRFPVSVSTIPRGNVVVIGESGIGVPRSLKVDAVSGPTLAMRTNPGDPDGKVLLLTGESGDDLVKAATVLALRHTLLQGSQISLPGLEVRAARQPDDAPRWLSTSPGDTEQIGTAADAANLEGDGTQPARIYLRLPPDLYYGDGFDGQGARNLALHVSYRYNGVPLGEGSALEVSVNGRDVGALPLPHTDRTATTVRDVMVPVPIESLRPFSNTVLLRFAFQAAKSGGCTAGPTGFSGTILKDTHLDVNGLPHWTALPNLELFANAGFPFTRRADLSETTVILPDQPSPEELELFLTMMGHFGAQTGYPVTGVRVGGPEALTKAGKTDLLVFGTADDLGGIRSVDKELPVGVDEDGLQAHTIGGLFGGGTGAWWKVRGTGGSSAARLDAGTGLPDGLIEEVEWPGGSRRSMVVVVVRDGAAVSTFLSGFLRESQTSQIAQSVSVLRAGQFTSSRAGGAAYTVGRLPAWTQLRMSIENLPWVIVVVTVIFCFLIASLLRASLRRSARMRLQGNY